MSSLAPARSVATSADEDLVRRASLGDRAAFDSLVGTRIDRCYRIAWSILSNDADAADATQDGFVAAWRELPRLRNLAAFDGWLNRIVANAARMSRRRRVRLREISMDAEPVDPPASRPSDESGGIREVASNESIGRAFDRLRPNERLILVLHHVEERPVSEIARTLGIPLGTAKWRLHAARRALEQAMEVES